MTTTCCYEGCEKIATETDSDGDDACAVHAAQSAEYVIVLSLDDEHGYATSEMAEVAESRLSEEGWSVSIRQPRQGEAEGTYLRDARGALQILGYSIPVPAALREAERAAWEQG